MAKIQRNTYGLHIPSELLVPEKEFFSVKGKNLQRNRGKPFRANTYVNLMRNVGTIDWYTGIPVGENTIPKYFVDKKNSEKKNPDYKGEFFFLNSGNTASGIFRPNSIIVKVSVKESDTLVINQNFHHDWHTDKGVLQNHNGLLGLRSPVRLVWNSDCFVPRNFSRLTQSYVSS